MMTTTAFITHCWRSARLDLAFVLVCACLAWCQPRAAHAESVPAEVTQFRLESNSDGILLSAVVRFELPPSVEDALLKGVSMFFVAQAEVYRERWYWTDKKVTVAERNMRLVYQPLSRRWRLNVTSGSISNNPSGVALNQSFDTLEEALAAVQRLSRWKIADAADVEPDYRYSVLFNFRLDVSQVPRPLQIGALGQSDWNISTFLRRPLVLESAQ
jgi:hypothetical protein